MLFKTTLVIWSNEDPRDMDGGIAELGQDAEDGSACCVMSRTLEVDIPEDDPDWEDHVEEIIQ